MFATSLPGGNPGFTVRAMPSSPLDARASMNGVRATSRGVFPPRSPMGSSAMPSPSRMMLFKGLASLFLPARDHLAAFFRSLSSTLMTTGLPPTSARASMDFMAVLMLDSFASWVSMTMDT